MSEKNEWKPIDSAPQTGRTLLLGYANSRGNWRTVRGQWMSAAYIAEFCEDPDDVEAGWFETSAEADEGQNCWPINPTHWMDLPAAPGSTSSAPGDAQDEQAAFENWLERTCPSGDVESVQRQWEASSDYSGLHAPAPDAGDALLFLADTDGAIESLTLGGNTRYRVWWPYLDERQAEWFASPLEAVDAALAAQVPQQGEA